MILVTGATGTLGQELITRLYPQKVRAVARNEGNLIELKNKHSYVEILTGDIADEWTAKKAMEGVDEVYHLAAYKHVGMAEKDSFQCINSNIVGSLNILRESLITRPKFVLGISTDKAAQVSGVYGATKLLMESVFAEAERINSDTKYRIVRYGNVLYSTGSVLCRWREQMKKGEGITITDPNATRFFWTAEEAVDLIFDCLKKGKDSKPVVTKMKSMAMGDLLEAMMSKYGVVEVKAIGLQPGENKHETIDGKTYSDKVEQFTIEEITKKI